ncbi:flavin-containing amine oxidase [Aspergillus nomiae NRRL 13137]|uniref:Amine oxidase n=1 Tax=Aspergillus nomiae NRRL (strain ATCC 15546 / NRRL 13137 / CBS 260.88 / M93) TaxID=1509407 RepID=A0A0L1JCY9_ASPN3|nr:flavin-containing amine oxidase [Aspergillus nomiae NRRL 13137]KNG89605.1 flavin-containing amine oxidase [Aspergillus nomiae NRRL 13137]
MFDVVIIGAGLSGLQAAYSAKNAGLKVVVVEARNRVGGKVWTVPLASGRGYADLGAAWINDELQKRVTAYARQFGLKTTKQRLEGKAVMQLSGDERFEFPFGITPEFSPEETKNLEYIRDHIQAKSLRSEPPLPEDDSVTIEQYLLKLGAGPKTLAMVNVWAKAMHGLEIDQYSAAWFIDYCRTNCGLLSVRADDHTGGNYMRFEKGAQQLPNGLAKLIGEEDIRLNEPIASIQDHQDHVTVTTTTGNTYTARKCILSIPSTLYKDINIFPKLPLPVQDVTNNTVLGHYNKSIVCYNTPWWRKKEFNGFFVSYGGGPVAIARDSSVDEIGYYSLTCFVNGRPGEKWGNSYPHERRAAVLNQLAAIFNAEPDSELWRPLEIFEQVWQHERYSKGALAPVHALGHYTKYAAFYGKPVGNLHFVGTEYSREWKGYMEGALCSGEIGAQEVIDTLKQGPTAKL